MHLCVDFHVGPSKEYLIFFLFLIDYRVLKWWCHKILKLWTFSNIVWKNLSPKINIQNIGSLLDETTIFNTVQNFSLPTVLLNIGSCDWELVLNKRDYYGTACVTTLSSLSLMLASLAHVLTAATYTYLMMKAKGSNEWCHTSVLWIVNKPLEVRRIIFMTSLEWSI